MKVVADHRRARFDYEIRETVEAGLILSGQEVKACRAGQVNLAGAYVTFLQGNPILKKMKISPYKFASGLDDYDPERDRPLLLKQHERKKLQNAVEEKGVTVIPLEVRAGKYIKVLLGLGRGRKKFDKRQKIKERETGRRLREGREI
ncbi:SsrA-binding protein SmpB [Candidatus Peregrinibacteria bacterium]|nr:SsrA-binding protein SmpB [Candidatus Peregrinibacteria bacterium]